MDFRKQILKMTEASDQVNMLKVTGAKFTVQTLSPPAPALTQSFGFGEVIYFFFSRP